MMYIKNGNVIYKKPIFAPPARPKPPMLYMNRVILRSYSCETLLTADYIILYKII